MTRLTLFVSLGLALSSIPIGLAGPACAKKHFQVADCVSICKSRWGWSGSMMGTDPWGSVMKKVDTDTWDAVISKACGTPVISSTASTDSTLSTSTAQETGNANPTVVVTTASTTSSAVPSITSAVSSKISSASSSASVLGLLASTRRSSSTVTGTPRPTATRITTVRQTATTSPQAVNPEPTSTPDVVSSSGGTSNADIEAYLAGHNTIRAKHGASPLSWSDNLASKAQQWADGCQFKHSSGSLGPFGENLAAGTGSTYGIAEAIKSWTDEVSDYNPSNPVPSHFTQVVWKATTQVGCAVQSCNGIFAASFGPAKYFVCEYSIQGNLIGAFAENVQV